MRLVQDISITPQKMKFKNSGNSTVQVEVISDDVEIRIGEMKWVGIAYTRDGKPKVYVRTKAEFKAKFTPVIEQAP
jgi:hypothetical protein